MIAEWMKPVNPATTFKAMSDSGWLLDNPPVRPKENCDIYQQCPLEETIIKGHELWKPVLPIRCTSAGFTWECYFAYKTAQTIQAPFFVFMYLYDNTQLAVDGNSPMTTQAQFDYADKLPEKTVATFQLADSHDAYFLPNCMGHEIITKDAWLQVKINGDTTIDALAKWYAGESVHVVDGCTTRGCNPTCP